MNIMTIFPGVKLKSTTFDHLSTILLGDNKISSPHFFPPLVTKGLQDSPGRVTLSDGRKKGGLHTTRHGTLVKDEEREKLKQISDRPQFNASPKEIGDKYNAWKGGKYELNCEHFESCSGCTLATKLHQPAVLHDAIAFFSRSHGFHTFKLTTGDISEWRCRAKLAVRGGNFVDASEPLIGLFEHGTHMVQDIPDCRAHHPALNATTKLLKQAMADLGVQPYNEQTGEGLLRYIQMVLTTNNTSLPEAQRYAKGRVQLSLVLNARHEHSPEVEQLLPQLVREMWRLAGPAARTQLLHSVWANFQTTSTNVIFGGRWRHLVGDALMWQRVCGVDVAFVPGSFGQANYKAFEFLLRRLHTFVPPLADVAELYAGAGVIGLTIAAACNPRRVRCVEVNAASEAPFKHSLARMGKAMASKVSWHCADANQSPLQWLQGSDIVVVDPPRKGLDPPVIQALRLAAAKALEKKGQTPLTREVDTVEADTAEVWPHTLIYVSCGWEAMKEDCKALTAGGIWHLAHAEGVQFFPGTNSMEVLALFKVGQKKKEKKRRQTKSRLKE